VRYPRFSFYLNKAQSLVNCCIIYVFMFGNIQSLTKKLRNHFHDCYKRSCDFCGRNTALSFNATIGKLYRVTSVFCPFGFKQSSDIPYSDLYSIVVIFPFRLSRGLVFRPPQYVFYKVGLLALRSTPPPLPTRRTRSPQSVETRGWLLQFLFPLTIRNTGRLGRHYITTP